MRAAAFSADGSVLAVAADTVITLWDPDRNELIAVVGETPKETRTVLCLNCYHVYRVCVCVCFFALKTN